MGLLKWMDCLWVHEPTSLQGIIALELEPWNIPLSITEDEQTISDYCLNLVDCVDRNRLAEMTLPCPVWVEEEPKARRLLHETMLHLGLLFRRNPAVVTPWELVREWSSYRQELLNFCKNRDLFHNLTPSMFDSHDRQVMLSVLQRLSSRLVRLGHSGDLEKTFRNLQRFQEKAGIDDPLQLADLLDRVWLQSEQLAPVDWFHVGQRLLDRTMALSTPADRLQRVFELITLGGRQVHLALGECLDPLVRDGVLYASEIDRCLVYLEKIRKTVDRRYHDIFYRRVYSFLTNARRSPVQTLEYLADLADEGQWKMGPLLFEGIIPLFVEGYLRSLDRLRELVAGLRKVPGDLTQGLIQIRQSLKRNLVSGVHTVLSTLENDQVGPDSVSLQ